MEWPYPLENIWIIFLQQISAWLVGPMQILTMLGNEEFYFLVMPVLYWSINSVLGIRIAILLLLSNAVGNIFKLIFHCPRPYWISPQVQAFSAETTFGFPSGHALNAAAIWGYLAYVAKARLLRSLLLLLVFLIGFSRIILGMHFISDVIREAGQRLAGPVILQPVGGSRSCILACSGKSDIALISHAAKLANSSRMDSQCSGCHPGGANRSWQP